MHGLNKAFRHDPLAFMKKYPISTAGKLNGKAADGNVVALPKIAVYDFDLSYMGDDKTNVVLMLFDERGKAAGSERERKKKVIKAYWLPWASASTTKIELKDEADYFFTSALDGCRIQFAGATVLHIAADGKIDRTVNNRTGKEYLNSTTLQDQDDPNLNVEWKNWQAKEHLKEMEPRSRKFSSTTDYGDFGFFAGYRNKQGVWTYIKQIKRRKEGGGFTVRPGDVEPISGGEVEVAAA